MWVNYVLRYHTRKAQTGWRPSNGKAWRMSIRIAERYLTYGLMRGNGFLFMTMCAHCLCPDYEEMGRKRKISW